MSQPADGQDGRTPILMYHQIAAVTERPGRLAVGERALAGQLAQLRDAGFGTVTAAGLAAELAADLAAELAASEPTAGEPTAGGPAAGAGAPRHRVAITFDDGYADFYDRALPLLARHGFTASLYVTTGWLRGRPAQPACGPARPRPGEMLSPQQLAEIAAAGVEIGAHGVGHAPLDTLPADKLARELADSKAELEDTLGQPVDGLAYPFGYANAIVRQAARAAGYRYACAVGNRLTGPRPDLFALPRLTIGRSTGPGAFGRIVRGERLGCQYLGTRALTRGFAAVRRAGTAGRWIRSRCA